MQRWHGYHVFDQIKAGKYEGILGQAPGSIFYVNGVSGSNSYNGSSKYPFLTIKYALSKCTTLKNDYIFVQDYWQPTGEDWPILIDKRQVHIIGLTTPGLPYPAIHPPGDTACFEIDADGSYSEIALLTIGGGNSHGGIEMSKTAGSGQCEGMHIHDCLFGHSWFGTPLHGIWLSPEGLRHTFGIRVEDCTFVGDLANCNGAITSNGIEQPTTLGAVAYDLQVRRCDFQGLAIGINLAKAQNGVLKDNLFVGADSATGEGITLGAGSLGCMASGNVGMNGGDAAATNAPFRDIAATNKNHWGLNWKSNTVVLPAQS